MKFIWNSDDNLKQHKDSFLKVQYQAIKCRRPIWHPQDWDEHDSFANQFNSQEDQFDVSYIDTSTDEVGQNEQEHTWPKEVESTHEYKIPNFDFQGDINDEGWEVCEYPRSSDIWWWKDYETGSWVLWE